MEIPNKVKDKFERHKLPPHIYYKRRKLDKEVKEYVKSCSSYISGRKIEEMGQRHRFFISS